MTDRQVSGVIGKFHTSNDCCSRRDGREDRYGGGGLGGRGEAVSGERKQACYARMGSIKELILGREFFLFKG